MKVTIEVNKLIYMYVRSSSRYPLKTISGVVSYLLYDEQDNWLGVEITNKTDDGAEIELPSVVPIDVPLHDGMINLKESSIEFLFDRHVPVAKKIEQDCNLDVTTDGIHGIEMILWSKNQINGKKYVAPYIIDFDKSDD